MYRHFYGLHDVPFSLAPDPRYLFRTESLLEVFANLQYCIEHGKGVVLMTGEVGTGKTLVLRSMLQSLDHSVAAAYIFNPLLSTGDFYAMLASEFRLRHQPSKAETLRMLGYFLLTRHQRGLRTVLVVDEAHLLPRPLLEEIRLMSNYETNREKLFQIILCGQPELRDVFAQPELRQLKQRISLRSEIQPLTPRETAEYIAWRLRIAGAIDPNIFEVESIAAVYRFSAGIPRIINNICDNALLSGFSSGCKVITPSIIHEVVDLLDLDAADISSPLTGRIDLSDSASNQTHRNEEAAVAANRDARPPTNVRYIRRDLSASGSGRPGVESSEARVSAQPDASQRFFSRARVART